MPPAALDFRHSRRMPPLKAADIPQRLPPHDLPSEVACIGCCLLSPTEAMPVCVEHHQEGMWFDLRHETLWQTMAAMFEERKAIDLVTVQKELKSKNQLEAIGGIPYLTALQDAVPSAANLTYYLDIIKEKALARKMIQVGTQMVQGVLESEGNVEQLLDQAEADVLAIRQQRQIKGSKGIKALVNEAVDKTEEYHNNQGQIFGVSTGFTDLDRMTHGLHGGGYYIIAARPSIGKTSLAMNIAEHVAVNQRLPVGIFSLEMTEEELAMRLLYSRAKVSMTTMRAGKLCEEDFPKITNSGASISKAPIFIDDTSGLSILQLRAKARRMWQQHGIKLFVIDYLQLLNSTNKKAETRQQEIADISQGVKSLAKELDVPIIVIAQLNRELEKDKNRKPRLSDLRESGSIEADADLVALLYKAPREEKDEDDQEPEVIPVNLLIAKQRNGPCGTVHLTFFKSSTRFESAAPDYSENDFGK